MLESYSRFSNRLLMITLFLAGALFWGWLLNWGEIGFTAYDWTKEGEYYAVLAEAVESGRVPLHSTVQLQNSTRFLANPEINLTPQVYLLAFFPAGLVVLTNTLIGYSLGFWSLIALRRRYGWGLTTTAVFWLIFNFNGHIVSHMAVGHTTWAAYFLFGFVLLFSLAQIDDRPLPARISLKTAAVLAAMIWLGGVHLFFWSALWLLVLALFNLRRSRLVLNLAGTLLWTAGLAAGRLLPLLIQDPPVRKQLPGFVDLLTLWKALTAIHRHNFADMVDFTFNGVKQWEVNHFIGLTGVFILLGGSLLGYYVNRRQIPLATRASIPAALFVAFSLHHTWQILVELPLGPIADLLLFQRTPTRFLIIPLLFLTVVSCSLIESLLREQRPAGITVISPILLIFLATGLVNHGFAWRLNLIEQETPVAPPAEVAILTEIDPIYAALFWAGLAISLIVTVAAVYLWRTGRERG